jgi:formylglycine-generating enzyme required for sulfatase activity
LYDTVGNVYEWCQDWWAASYPGGSVTNWQQTNQNASYPYKIERGGAWGSEGAACRSAARIQDYPDERALANSPNALNATGFRIVLAPINPP